MKGSAVKKTFLCFITIVCIAAGILSITAFAEGPSVTVGDVWRTTRTEAQAEFTSDTTGSYYYIVTPVQEEIPEIDISGEGTPCTASEKVTLTLSELTTDPHILWLVVKDTDGTVGEINQIQIPEWDWWLLDEYGVLTIESNKGVTNWNAWLNSMDDLYKMWYQQSVTGVYIWKDVTNIDDDFTGDKYPNIAAYSVEDVNESCTVIDGVLYNKDVTSIYAYPQAKEGTEFDIPSTVDYIGYKAFASSKYLESVTAGDVTISQSAFSDSKSLKSFSANSIKWIKNYAFYNCSKLESIAVAGGEKFSVDFCAFERCSSLKTFPFDKIKDTGHSVFRNCSSLTEIQVPDSIEDSAFQGCSSVETIVIPSTVTYIGSNAFYNCSSLSSVTFESETPPNIAPAAFNPVVPGFRIHVPEGSENAYIEALGEDFAEYILDESVELYALFVNGKRVRSDALSIQCGSGTAVFDPKTNTLTLTNAEISQAGGKYGYKGAINSGLTELNIVLVGENKITADADSLNTDINCNLTISGEGSLDCGGQIDIGRDGSLAFTGSEEDGNLIIDGAKVNISKYIFVQSDAVFKGGAKVTVDGKVTANFNGTVTITGEETVVRAKCLAIGNGGCLSEQTSVKLIMESGALTLTDGISYLSPPDGDTGKYAIRFDGKEYAEIRITGGSLRVAVTDGKITNALSDNIIVDETVEISTGAWDSDLIYINTPLFVAANNVVRTAEELTFTAKWKGAESGCIILAAVYDQDGSVIDVQMLTAAETSGEQEVVIPSNSWSADNSGSLKLFLWKENNIQPVCQSHTAQIGAITEQESGNL